MKNNSEIHSSSRLHLLMMGLLPVLTTLLVLLTGCMKEKNFRTYTMYRAEYKIKQEVKDAVRVTPAKSLKNSGGFVLYNNTMYINEKNEGLHVVDYSNPSNPQHKGFIPLPGNTGVAIKNNVLYADCYSDLFIIKVLGADQVQLVGTVTNAFASRMNVYAYDSTAVEVIWHKKDTTVTEEFYNAQFLYSTRKDNALASTATSPGTPGGGTSVGSSMAVFTIVNDFLYTIDQSRLNAFSISDLLQPTITSSEEINWNIETIFPFKDKLLIGSMTGMYIYSIHDPKKPAYLGQFNHARVCDPVIADGNYAYVTLRNGSACGGFVNQLDVIDISDVTQPVLLASFPFDNPHGLSKDGNVLFVCDGTAGLKIVDVSDPAKLVTKKTVPTTNKTLDVIAYGQLAYVSLDNAIQIYSYDQQFNVQLLGSISKQ